eukprot:m.111723 g.111723  ORF g.111723 m.111723 type:complete len:587 (+) comp15389_c0_seq4:92-1852(+)
MTQPPFDLRSLHDVWLPDVTLEQALTYSRTLEGKTAEQDKLLAVVFLRFLPLVNHHATSRKGPRCFKTDAAFANLLETIDMRLDDAEALCPCLNSICAISTQYASVPDLLEIDSHIVVKQVAARQPQHEGLIQMCMATISNLALHKQAAQPLIDNELHLTAITAIDQHTEPSLVECAVTCLANLANTRSKRVMRALLDSDTAGHSLRLLSSEEAGIRYHAALCLSNLSVSTLSHSVLLELDTSSAMLTVLIRDMESPHLAENVLGLLARLTQAGFVNDVMDMESMEHLLTALATHATRPTLQTYGCVVLLSFVAVLPNEAAKQQAVAVFKRRRAEFNAAFAAALLRRDEHVTNAYIRLIGMDPDRKHEFGPGVPITPLGYAVDSGSMEVVKTLLSNHAAPLADGELTQLANHALGLSDYDLRFRQLLCLGLINARKHDLDRVPLEKSKGVERLLHKQGATRSAMMRPVPVADVPPDVISDKRPGVSDKDTITNTRQLRHRLRGATPVQRTTAVGNSKVKLPRRALGTVDTWLDRIDRWLLNLVFDPRDGRLLVCRAVALVIGSSLLAGLIVGVALILATVGIEDIG